MEWDPQTGAELDADDMVEVGPAGTVESWTWVPEPVRAAPARPSRSRSRSSASTGPSTPLLHAVDAGSPERAARRRCGSRPAGGATRVGHIDRHRLLRARRDSPRSTATTPARPPSRSTMMDYIASITYRNPVPPVADRGDRGQPRATGSSASSARSAPGSTPAVAATARSTRSSSAEEHDVDLPHTGHDHELHDHHAGAVPGPDRDRAVRPGLRAARRRSTWSSPTSR